MNVLGLIHFSGWLSLSYPWTPVVCIDGISIFLRGKFGTGVFGDPIPELAVFSAKVAISIGVLVYWTLERSQLEFWWFAGHELSLLILPL